MRVVLVSSVEFLLGCSSDAAALASSDGGAGDAEVPDSGKKTDGAIDTGTMCSLATNTTATTTVTSECTLVTRDVSSCQALRMSQGLGGAWLNFSCRVALTKSGSNVTVGADSQPDYKSNYFSSTDACYTKYTTTFPDPNSISAQTLSMSIPLSPSTTGQAMGFGVVGVAINGVEIFDNVAAPGDDIFLEAGSFDPCQGHPAPGGRYHYHAEPYSISSNDSNLIGVMRDGYFIYGRLDKDGTVPTLDTNGGHTSATPDSTTAVYHYHVNLQTSTAPATVGTKAWFLTTGTYKGAPGTCTGCN